MIYRSLTILVLGLGGAVACRPKAASEPVSAVKDADQVSPSPALSPYQGPDGFLSAGDNRTLWETYCVGPDDVGQKPVPNYANADVLAAAAQLSKVFDHSFKLYADILAFYKTTPPSTVPGLKENAHHFLSYLCGEFRDRAPLIRAKINWYKGLNFVHNRAPNEAWNLNADVWSQVRSEDYQPYLAFSKAVWRTRRDALAAPFTIGSVTEVDRVVPGLSVCETKLIFSAYVRKGKKFKTLKDYEQTLAAFKASCSQDDLNWYYDFRGDSNFKPNTPEANGMIWFAQSLIRSCDTPKQAKPGNAAGIRDADCQRYFEHPFKSRWDSARAGLVTELLHDNSLQSDVRSQLTEAVVLARAVADGQTVFGDQGVYQLRLGDQVDNPGDPKKIMVRGSQLVPSLAGWQSHWAEADAGLTKLVAGPDLAGQVQTRLEILVNRHTNWYATGFDNGVADLTQAFARPGAWSPFVASSYEMSRSDNFTSPGYTVVAEDPESTKWKHWMFVFKVRKDHLYNTDRLVQELAAGAPAVDFDHYWFDERTFGTDGLAQDERAWDRLGEPLEDEYAGILYLHNLNATPIDTSESEGATKLLPHL